MKKALADGLRWIGRNLDALLVISGASVVFALDLSSDLDPQVVGSATLALLGVTAFVLLRDRSERKPLLEFRDRASTALGELDGLKEIAGDALCELPYEVVSQTCEWDIRDRNLSITTTTQRLRFVRGYISTMESWCRGPGGLRTWTGSWKFPQDEHWNVADPIHEIADVEGGTKKIFVLAHEHARNDRIDWRVIREVEGGFPRSSESVGLLPLAPEADHPRLLRVIWPADAKPSSVSLRYGQQEMVPVALSHTEAEEPRAYVEKEINELVRHGKVEVIWTW